MINDKKYLEFNDLKEQYKEKANINTGVVSEVAKSLNNFVSKFDEIKNKMLSDRKELYRVYTINTSEFEAKESEFYNTFNAEVSELRETTKGEIENAIQELKTKVVEIVTKPISDAEINDMNIIKNLNGSMSDSEIMMFLDKHKKCYLVTKAILQNVSEERQKALNISFTNAEIMLENLDSIQNYSEHFIRNYNGALPYKMAMILDGEMVYKANEMFETFVSKYN